MTTTEAVNVVVNDSLHPGSTLAGVVVKVLSTDGLTVFGQDTTDSSGIAHFLLPAPATYEVRLYKFSYVFTPPRYLLSVVSGALNVFDCYGTPFVYPSATDPRLCLASGFFRTPSGGVAAGVDVHFLNKFNPLQLDGSGVLTEMVIVRTDSQGYVEVPLIRYGHYTATVQGVEGDDRLVRVPNSAWVNISSLLFPVVESIFLDAPDPIVLAVGENLVVPTEVYSSDFNQLENITADVAWSFSVNDICAISYGGNNVNLRGVVAGSTELRAARKDSSVVRIPDTAITGMPRAITVTP